MFIVLFVQFLFASTSKTPGEFAFKKKKGNLNSFSKLLKGRSVLVQSLFFPCLGFLTFEYVLLRKRFPLKLRAGGKTRGSVSRLDSNALFSFHTHTQGQYSATFFFKSSIFFRFLSSKAYQGGDMHGLSKREKHLVSLVMRFPLPLSHSRCRIMLGDLQLKFVFLWKTEEEKASRCSFFRIFVYQKKPQN